MKARLGLAEWRKASLSVVAGMLALLGGCGHTSPTSPPQLTEPRARVKIEMRSARYDLERDEERGGHTLKKHVGRSDAQLQERLDHERNISAASTWTDRETAEISAVATLHAENGRVFAKRSPVAR